MKPILVLYLGVKHIKMDSIQDYAKDINNQIANDEKLLYIIPDFENYTSRLECINPVLMDKYEYFSTKQILDKMNDKLESFMNNDFKKDS